MPEYSGQVTHVELAWIPLWLIVLLPFLGAAINAVFGVRLQRSPVGKAFSKRYHIGSFPVSAVALSVMAGAFVLAVIDVVQLALMHDPGHRYLFSHAWQMVRIGSVDINFAFAMDTLGAVMTLVVTGVGSLIHVYATGYMADDPAYWRFFSYFNLFIFSLVADQVMMPLATSALVTDLNTNTGMVQIAIAFVSLVAAPLYITGGKLGDINGKKRVFLVGVVLFAIGPLTAALAPNITVLIGGWSIIKALGMVRAVPASIGLLIASYPDDTQRGQAFAIGEVQINPLGLSPAPILITLGFWWPLSCWPG